MAFIDGTDNNDLLDGTTGVDFIQGFGGNDVIFALEGNDFIIGGLGADKMLGGDGSDFYEVDNILDQAIEIRDDDIGGIDRVGSSVDFTLGFGIEELTLIGIFAVKGVGNDGDNVITGNEFDNRLSGGLGNDWLVGGNGRDELHGDAGVDTLNGGAGNDYYYIYDLLDTIIGEVTDSVTGGVDFVESSVSYTLGVGLENLILLSGNIDGTGNVADNFIYGGIGNNVLSGLDGNDFLQGGGGRDIMDGGVGNDTMVGSSGSDTYVIDSIGDVIKGEEGSIAALAAPSIDSVYSSIDYTLSDWLESLFLTGLSASIGVGNSLSNEIGGNEADNSLKGLNGNDFLTGEVGKDTLDGGDGSDLLIGDVAYVSIFGDGAADILVGGAGDDTYIIGEIIDTIIEVNDDIGGVDSVNSTISYTLGLGVENLFLDVGNINGKGNISNNVLESFAGNNALSGLGGNDTLDGGLGNDVLNGGLGVDLMTGGLGNDSYFVDNSLDVIVENAGVGMGTDTVKSTISYNLGANLERLTLLGATNLNGSGNNLNNIVTGNNGANNLKGLNGNDTLNGGAGNDTLAGGLGLDKFQFNTILSSTKNLDTLADFSVADDTILLENASFKSLSGVTPHPLAAASFVSGAGAVAHDANDFLIYNTTTGALTYDANGNAAGGAIQFATVVGIPPLTAADFLIV